MSQIQVVVESKGGDHRLHLQDTHVYEHRTLSTELIAKHVSFRKMSSLDYVHDEIWASA